MEKEIQNIANFLRNSENELNHVTLFKPRTNKLYVIANTILWFSITGTIFWLPSFRNLIPVLALLWIMYTFSIVFFFRYQERTMMGDAHQYLNKCKEIRANFIKQLEILKKDLKEMRRIGREELKNIQDKKVETKKLIMNLSNSNELLKKEIGDLTYIRIALNSTVKEKISVNSVIDNLPIEHFDQLKEELIKLGKSIKKEEVEKQTSLTKKKLSKKERSSIAKQAALKRWKKKREGMAND